MSGLRLGVHERLRARTPTTPEAVNELAAGMRTGRVLMNERGCPCLDHATACADRNHGRKIRARYPPVFPTREEASYFMRWTNAVNGSCVPSATVITINVIKEGGLGTQGGASWNLRLHRED